MNHVLKFEELQKIYEGNEEPVVICENLTWELPEGDAVAIVGESGTGKSTLLHLAGALDRPNKGRVWVSGRSIADVKEKDLGIFRAKTIGMVFQFHFLLKEFSAWENVYLPACMAGENRKDAKDYAWELLKLVGLENRKSHFPGQLSGGERQRVALARALVNRPQLILADEPTGNLDGRNSLAVQDLLLDLVQKEKKSLLLVTHDLQFAARTSRTYKLVSGELVVL